MVRICLLIGFMAMGYASSPRNSSIAIGMPIRDTVKVDTLIIDTVVVSKLMTSEDKYDRKKDYHKEIFLLGDNKKMFMLPHTGGLAINVNKLYNHFSNRGKGARRLQRTFEREYEDDLTNEIWNPLVTEYSSLKGDTLRLFAIHAKPSYAWIAAATLYERLEYVQKRERGYVDSLAFFGKWLMADSL